MAITTYPTKYYDDFNTVYPSSLKTANDKNYLRILFKPGYSVQVRELNQMQSMLQSQIDKFGRSTWKDNVTVSGGETKFVTDIQCIEFTYSGTEQILNLSTILAAAADISGIPNGASTNIYADVLYGESVNVSTYRFYITYRSSTQSGTGTNISSFVIGDTFTVNSSIGPFLINKFDRACGVYMAAGVFFTKGCFVASPEQKIFIKLDETESTVIGNAILKVNETTVDYVIDPTLLDNAAGQPNYSAPGADRYKIDLVLDFVKNIDAIDGTKIILKTVVNSIPTATVDDRTAYQDTQLAQRTFEESGNYVLDPFKITIRELFDDGTNLGRFTESNLDKAGYVLAAGQTYADFVDDAKGRYSLEVDKSTAYVEGHRIALNGKYDINATKARFAPDAPLLTNTNATIGNYIIGTFNTGSFLPDTTDITRRFNLNAAEVMRTATLSIGSADIYILSTEGLVVGMPVISNGNIAVGVEIASINSLTNRVTLVNKSNPLVAPVVRGGPYTLTFSAIPLIDNAGPATCKIKTVELEGGNLYRIYLYDIQMRAGTSVNIAQLNRLTSQGGDQPVDFTITQAPSQTSSDTAIFPLPYNAVKSVSNVRYTIRHCVDGTTQAGNPTLSYALPNNGSIDLSGLIILNVGTSNSTKIVIPESITSSTIVLKPGDTPDGAYAWRAFIPVSMEGTNNDGQGALDKILDESTISFTGGNIIGLNEFTLPHADVFKLTGITFKSRIDADAVDIPLSDCIISDDGQRSNYYTNVKVKYNGPKIFSNDNIITFSYLYLKRADTINGFATADSYSHATNIANGLTYDTIPSFNGKRLSDVIDFRPIILNTSTTTNNKQQIDPGSALLSKSRIYLPRIDRLVVSTDAKFIIEPGTPAIQPVEAEPTANTMALYTLEIPAYTYNTADIKINYIDNRRYTMRDIGKLETRITNLETYTELSKLENIAQNKVITDILGSRFKNAVLTDGFMNHNIGDNFNPAYNCSIDPVEGIARPAFSTRRINFNYVAPTSQKDAGIKIGQNLVTLHYIDTGDLTYPNEEWLINQPYASSYESVNPYEIATYNGNIELSPNTDEWKDVTIAKINTILDTRTYDDAVKNTIVGTVWNNWTTAWTGQPSVTKSGFHSVFNPDKGFKMRQIITTSPTLQKRTGMNTSLTYADIVERKEDRVIDVSFIPFMRSRKVYFRAKRLKPYTRVYPFFDGIDISAYTTSTPFLPFSTSTLVRDYKGVLPIPATNLDFVASPLITNDYGEVEGMFLVPNNNALKFKVGTRAFKLTDSPRNIEADATTFVQGEYTATGISETRHTDIITTRVPQVKTINVTDSRNAVDTKVTWDDPLAQSFMLSNISTGAYITSIDIYFQAISTTSPVSIHIVTMENGYPTQKIVPFSVVTRNPYAQAGNTNDPLIPISTGGTEIDPLVKFVPTNFKFSDPVYLKANTEYAIVIMSNDPKYKVWVADSNGFDASTGKPINKNVYAGVFFKSQNGSTWSADQTRDLKFKINRAKFSSTGNISFKPILDDGVSDVTVMPQAAFTNTGFGPNAKVVFPMPIASGIIHGDDTVDYRKAKANLIVDPLTTAVIAVNITDHGKGYSSADTAARFNSNTIWQSNGSELDPANPSLADKFTVSLDSASMTSFNVTLSNINMPGTSIDTVLTLGTGTSKIVSPIDIYENYDLNTKYAINSINAPQTTLTSTIRTTSDYVSPIIDLDRVSLLAILNEVNNLTFNEDIFDAGTAKSRYLTKLIKLDKAANQLNVYLDVNRPSDEANIAVYIKLIYDGNENIPTTWTHVNPTSPVAVSSNYTDFAESEYVINSAANDFLAFAVKIVFLSSNSYEVASIANLKVIATTGL